MGQKIKLCHILEAGTGGTRRHLQLLLPYLDEKLFEVSLITSIHRDPDFEHDIESYKARGIQVEIVPMQRAISPAKDFRAFFHILDYLKELGPDILHLHSSKAGALGRMASCFLSRPRPSLVYTPHCPAFAGAFSENKKRLYKFIERSLNGFTDFVIALTEEERKWMMSVGPAEKINLIPNGIPLPEQSQVTILKTLGALGRFTEQKGYDILIKAMPFVLKKFPDIKLVLRGKGELKDFYQEIINALQLEKSVFLENDEKRLTGFDMFLMPSRWEGLSYSMLEALGAGIPLAAHALPGIMEMIQDSVNGFLVRNNTPDGWAADILKILGKPKETFKVGQQGRALISENYKHATWIKQMEKFYLNTALP